VRTFKWSVAQLASAVLWQLSLSLSAGFYSTRLAQAKTPRDSIESVGFGSLLAAE
jgi:hypothetical protein